nr:hypothetical protein [Chloroflexota bacterium]
MTPIPLIATHLFLAAVFCFMGNVAIRLLVTRLQDVSPSGRWQNVIRAAAGLAFLCLAVGLALSATQRNGWPLMTGSEVIVASAAAAILWRFLHPYNGEWKWEALCDLAAGALVIWGIVRWPMSQIASVVQAVPQPWQFALHLLLSLACGAFIHAGSIALACLLTETRIHKTCGEKAGYCAVSLGLPFLTASLLLNAIIGLYTRGTYWDWSTVESWQLLAWLLYAIVWCAWVVLGWRGRRIWVLTTLGLVLILLVLHTI